MNPLQFWQVIGGIVVACGVLYTVVTLPLLRLLKAEGKLTRAEIALAISGVKADLAATETRLNERIDTRLVHR